MKLGILSDTHSNRGTTLAALEIFRAEGVNRLVHCGDITSAVIVRLFEGWHVTFVYGNMDQDKTDLALAAQHIGRPAPQHVARLTIDGYPIAVTHGHHGLERLISEQEYRYVMHGHTHARRDTVIGRTRVINPGALGGRKPAPRHIAVLDTASDDLRFIEVPE